MNPAVFAMAAVAGGLGAVARWALDLLVARKWTGEFPLGILVVNVTGSLLLGVVTGSLEGTTVAFIVGAGLLGGYTTFSSVAATTAVMLSEHRTRAAVLNAAGTFVLSVAAAAVGLAVGSAF